MNLHPGIIPVLRRLNANELDIAKMIVTGDLTSPQRFHNVTLYKIRITGIGVSYRPAHDEYTYRRPEDYLTGEFLERCNGLPVIMNHPKDSMLNSEEFADRVVGTVFVPFIENDEVWAIAKIYDDEAIALLGNKQMSTSPAVILSKSTKQKLDDDTTVLVEVGAPKLLDHIALCANGVWDKGGDPVGVVHVDNEVRKDSAMTEEERMEKEKADAAARADAEKRADEKFDMLLKAVGDASKKLDSLSSRMDAFEKKEGEGKEDKEDKEDTEAKEKAADKARKDAEEEEKKNKEEEERKDAARADAIRADFEARYKAQEEKIKSLETLLKPLPESSRAELTDAQARADSVMSAFGDAAPRPLAGETSNNYRRRIAGMLQKHSSNWAKVPLDGLNDEAFAVAEKQIYADSAVAARRPTDIGKGQMREITRTTATGHRVTEFYANGDTHFVQQFRRPLRKVGAFRIPR